MVPPPCSSRAILEHSTGPGGSGIPVVHLAREQPCDGREFRDLSLYIGNIPIPSLEEGLGKIFLLLGRPCSIQYILEFLWLPKTLSCCWLYSDQTFPEVRREALVEQRAPDRNKGDVQARRMCFISLHPVKNDCLYWDQSKHPSQPAQRTLGDLFS